MGRLGYLLSHYPSANHTYLLREIQGLRAAGIDVTVVAIDSDARPAEGLTPDEVAERGTTFAVKRAGIAAITFAHVMTAVTAPGRYAAGLACALRLAGPDLRRLAYHVVYFAEAVVAGRRLSHAGCVHVHTHYASTVALIAARTFGFDLSASIHGSAEFIDPRAQRLKEKIAACSFVRAISIYGRSQLMLACEPAEWSKLAVVRLGVDPDAFTLMPRRKNGGRFRIVTIGQLQPAKGFHILLDAIAVLVQRSHDLALTIVGDGADRDALTDDVTRLGISDRVTFTGALTQPAVRSVLASADAFALPSLAEGIPVVLMEAMATGLPCVASRITGIPELIDDGVSGLLVTPSDVNELARALACLVEDEALRARIGDAGRERVVRDYNLQQNTLRLVALFRAKVANIEAPQMSPVGRPAS